MDDGPDFERLGDLLGDVCEGAALRCPSPEQAADAGRASGGWSDHRPTGEAASDRNDPGRRLAVAWPDVVGAEVAANARPARLHKGRLTVSVSSSVWAQTLQFMSETVVARINDKLGETVVEAVVFRHAGWEERPREGRRPARPVGGSGGPEVGLSEERREALDRLQGLDLPPELKARIARAVQAALVRGEQGSVR